eukprot:gene38694-52275_t
MPKSYVRIYANGRNITLKDSIGNLEVHTNFNITQSKQNQETLILLNRLGKVADYTKIRKTQLGQSVGRFPDGSKTWNIFKNGTPGSGNLGKNFSKFAETPTFSLNSGFFDKNVRVAIGSKQKNVTLYYTLDGSEPTLKSKIYETPIDIDKTTVLKAMAVSNDKSVYPSFLNYATYFFNEETPLMVVSISGTDSLLALANGNKLSVPLIDTTISGADSLLALANGNKELRPFGSVEIFLEKKLIASAYGEFNKHGEDSWKNNQRALDFECVDGMGHANELGHLAAGTPGNVAGYCEALSRFGTMALPEVVAPAIRQAREGFMVRPYVHYYWAIDQRSTGQVNTEDKLRLSETGRAVYFHPDGSLKRPGD